MMEGNDMKEQTIRMKSKRKKGRRILAALLALCVFATSCPDMPGAAAVRAAEPAEKNTAGNTMERAAAPKAGAAEPAKSAESAESARSAYMWYDNTQPYFNVRGIDNDKELQTTYWDRGYTTASKVNGNIIRWNSSKNVTMGNSLFGSRQMELVYNGRYVRIRYTVENKGSTEQEFQVGSSADVMIDDNDYAEVVGTGNGLKMDGAPKNNYKYNLAAPTATTTWYGFFAEAYRNMFKDLADKTVPYNDDSGMAWSWTGKVEPGQKWSRYVLLGVGELPPSPKKPELTADVPRLVIGKTRNVTGKTNPGCTVCVEVLGQEYTAVADGNGKFSVPITLSEDAVIGETTLGCYAVSPEGGLSDTLTKQVEVVGEPFISLTDTATTILEDSTVDEEWYLSFVKKKVGTVTYTSTVNTKTAGTYTVTYRVSVPGYSDKTAALKVTVLPKPLELSSTTAARVAGKASFSLSAKLNYTGGEKITETGFVWGIMMNPTTGLCNGQVKTSSAVKTKGGTLKGTATDIVDGVVYHVRAYAKNAAGQVWYGAEDRFDINAKKYGEFTIKNNGDNTFTVTRTNGTDGRQMVDYRTLSGSAISGLHFAGRSSTLTFAEGETTKTIEITERGTNIAFATKSATAYTNADRVYWIELYHVDGGGKLGSTTRAKRSMAKDSSYTVNRAVYGDNPRSVSTSDDNKYVVDRSKTKAHQPFFTNNRGYNQTHGCKNFNTQRSFDIGTARERAYLKQTATNDMYYRLRFKAKEKDDAWEHIWIANHAPNNFNSSNEHNGPININDSLFGAAKYTARFDITSSSGADVTIPGTASRTNIKDFASSVRTGAVSGGWLKFGRDETVNVWFAATGKDADKWYMETYTDYMKVVDETEPQLCGVGSVGLGTFRPGDEVNLPLIFDEIVDNKNSTLSGVTLSTSWGTFTYAGGADTNVLYFKGKVPENASSTLKVNKINGADKIKDMCDTSGRASGGTGSTTVSVDNKAPAVSITNPTLTNGTAQAVITATNADTLQYAWSQTSAIPAAGWISSTSGTKVTNRQTSGTWYLHARAVYKATGREAFTSCSFNFSGAASGKLPDIALSVDNSAWARERKINITKKEPAGAVVKVRTPSGAEQTVSGNSYMATANGCYTFTLTAGGETVVKSATVTKIDRAAPSAQITEPKAKVQTENVTFTVTPADVGGSGVKNVTGTWTKTTNGGSRVTEKAVLAKQDDGTYKAVTTGTAGSNYTYRLSVDVEDYAGNKTTSAASSGTYTVNLKAPTVTVQKKSETNKGYIYTYKVNANGNTITAVNLPDDTVTTELSGEFTLTAAGTYYVIASDSAGHVARSPAINVAQGVDFDAPEIRVHQRDTKWAKQAKLELSIYEKSGIQSIKMQREGAGATTLALNKLQTEAGSSDVYHYNNIAITANGKYTFTVTDTKGNAATAEITVKNIDKTAPVLTAKASATPRTSGWYTDTSVPLVMTFRDPVPANGEGGTERSGLASVQYKLVSKTDKNTLGTATPSGLKSVSASDLAKGTYTINLTQMGTWYLYVKATDQVGNEYKGYCNVTGTASTLEIKKDHFKGSLASLSGPEPAKKETEGLPMTIKVNYGPSGGKMTADGQSAPIASLAANDGSSTKQSTVRYTTKKVGVNRFYIQPASWGGSYYWTYYVHRVRFDSQGGSDVPSYLVWTRQNENSTSTAVDCKVAEPAVPTRKGYTFHGWYTDAACTDSKKFDFDNQTQLRDDMTLYAKWTQDVYQVKYDLMMPDFDVHFSNNMENTDCTPKSSRKYAHRHYKEVPYTAPADKTEYRYGDNMKLPIPTLDTIRRTFDYESDGETKTETYSVSMTGFTFDGWYDNEQYTGRKYTTIEAEATGNKKYYAKWLDTRAPSFYGTWWSGDGGGSGSWYGANTYSLGIAFTDNIAVKNSMQVKIDDGEWKAASSTNHSSTPSYSYANQYIAWVSTGSSAMSEGKHTYRVRAEDEAGNQGESPQYTIWIDRGKPAVTGDLTYSVEPIARYKANSNGQFSDTQVDDSKRILFFNQVPTISISGKDEPLDENGICSGLWKVTYTLTDLDMKTGEQKPSTEEPRYTNPRSYSTYFANYSSTEGVRNGTVSFKLPENWRGTITNIRLYDRANNYVTIPDIGEVVVDTLPPVVRDEKMYFFGNGASHVAELEDKWYTQEELTGRSLRIGAYLDHDGRDAEGNPIAGAPIKRVRCLVNGKHTGGVGNIFWTYNPNLGLGDAPPLSTLTGVNEITLEVTDMAGNTATVSTTIKIGGGQEKTPEAARDYPADAITQLAKNADYKITVDGTTYTVNSGVFGRIPFVLTHDLVSTIPSGREIDLCGKTIVIRKKGISGHSDDSEAQTLDIKARPAALNMNDDAVLSVDFELLEKAEDAQINLKIADSTYVYEYSTDGGKTWKQVPADKVIKNLPSGNIPLRAEAKANTTEAANDGWPHGKQGQKYIDPGKGKIFVQYDLNAANPSASGQPGRVNSLHYKSTLTRPSNPTRTGYQFMGWYTSAKPYQPGGSTEAQWRFSGEANANTVGEIIGTNREDYEERIVDNSIGVTLYAGWRETTKPTLNLALETDTSADGSGVMASAESGKWYPNLRVKMTYSDNVGVTALYYTTSTSTNPTWYPVSMSGAATSDNKVFTLPYTNLSEGSYTIRFKAVDAAGNETEKSISYKLDKTRPVLGEESYNSGCKNIWHWTIRKSNLVITIPVTETNVKQVEYTLMPFTSAAVGKELTEEVSDDCVAAGNPGVKTASVSGGKAAITLPADFKGAIKVKAVDLAGNCSEEKQIGVKAPGIKGLFVENNAPEIAVKANGASLSTGYYDTAPELSVDVTDLTGGKDKNAGIASITWQIGSGTKNTVKADFDAQPTRDYTFTLNELAGKTGVFNVNFTATDQAGNAKTKSVTVKIKSKAATPAVTIDYANEKLTGLAANAEYDVRGETFTADGSGCIRMAEDWFGTDNFQISRKAYREDLLDSDCAVCQIAARPEAPDVSVAKDETIRGKADAQLDGVSKYMEYSADGGGTWTGVRESDLKELTGDVGILDVPTGILTVRVKATASAPHGCETEVRPNAGRALTVTFHPMGGSNVSAVTDRSWHDTVEQPADPARAGHDFVGWYQDAKGEQPWHFEGDAGTEDRLEDDITLYAKWRDTVTPALSAALETNVDGVMEDVTGRDRYYPNLQVKLTYSDNVDVTKLYVSRDGGAYDLLGSIGGTDGSADISEEVPQGKTADGDVQYQFIFDDIAEGSHTYTFRAEDADGNRMETGALTAKLDTTAPALGEASFESGYKNLWDWIVRNENLQITVPINEIDSGVEEVAYTLVPAADVTDAAVITGTAAVEEVSDGDVDYQAKIYVASDFKGSVRIEAKDKAGNEADVKTIGTDDEDVKGLIVENKAPMITVHADRDITAVGAAPATGAAVSAAAASDVSGMTVSEEYYETAPELIVNVTDEENDTLNGLITGGIASLSYQIGDGEPTLVGTQDEYKNDRKTKVDFTIPRAKIPEGVTDITITAVDHAGNQSIKELTIKVKTPLDVPRARIGYVEETLTGLEGDTSYWISVDGEDDSRQMMTTDADGKIKLEEGWIGRTLSIVQISSMEARSNSPEQRLTIPSRPEAPVLGTEDESHPMWRDGTITGLAADREYEIADDSFIIQWHDADVTDGKITGLYGTGCVTDDALDSFGKYCVRVKAADHPDGTGNFTGAVARVTVGSGLPVRYDMPNAKIDYRETSLKERVPGGLVPNAEYKIVYAEDGETMTDTFMTDDDGYGYIEDVWMGQECQIIRSGYGMSSIDSEAQRLTIPPRPAAPAPVGKEVSGTDREDGMLTGLKADTAYEISTDGGGIWTEKTANGKGEITGLAAADYIVRESATDTTFASQPCEPVKVNGCYEVTLHGNGGSAGTELTDYTEGTGAVLPADWTRDSYLFTGWYDNEALDGEAVTDISATDTGAREYWAKWQCEKPEAAIAFRKTSLAGLVADAGYRLEYVKDGETAAAAFTADENGYALVQEDWMGRDCRIIRLGHDLADADSEAQSLTIPPRPAAPVPKVCGVSREGEEDGKLAGLKADTVYELSTDDGRTWKEKTADESGEITGLGIADYIVRESATDTNFTGLPCGALKMNVRYAVILHGDEDSTGTTLTDYVKGIGAVLPTDWQRIGYVFIGWYDNAGFSGEGITDISQTDTGEKEYWAKWKCETPASGIDYRETSLTGLAADTEYKLEYKKDGETVSGIITADQEGNVPIKEEWMGRDCRIICLGNGLSEEDSEAQHLTIPPRPEAPAPKAEDVSGEGREDGKLTGLKAGTLYEISTDDGKTWMEKTADGNGEITGLAAADYIVRESATDTNFASQPCEPVSVKKYSAATPAPDASAEPDATPAGSTDPNATPTPDASAEPNATTTPAASANPNATPIPDASADPNATPAPAASADPAVTPAPAASADPTGTVTPTEAQKAFDKEKSKLQLHSNLKAIWTGTNLKVSWGRVTGASGYSVYAQYCGKDFSAKSLNQVRNGRKTNITIKKINGKKLDTTKNFKAYVVAWKWKNGKRVSLAKTLIIHTAGKDSVKYTNIKKIQIKKISYTMKQGSTVALRPKAVLYDKRKKQLTPAHCKEFRYLSSNKKVAAVTAGGKVKAKGTGECAVYVFAKNGCKRRIKIRVKK